MQYQPSESPTQPRPYRWALSAALAIVVMLLSLGSFANTQAAVNPAPSAVTAAPSAAATAALTWLSSQLAANNNTLPGFAVGANPPKTDWGLTADAVLASIAAGQGSDLGPQAATNQLLLNLSDFTTYDPEVLGVRLAGPTAKVLLITESLKLRPSIPSGLTLEAELRSLMVSAGPQAGRFADRNPSGADSNNGFGQALAILGLSLTESRVPNEAIAFLLKQQCPNGGFRLIYSATLSCESSDRSDTDSTALALQALLSVQRTPTVSAALGKAVGWLLTQQDPKTGGFSGSATTAVINANSTGLSAQSLRAAGQIAAADQAANWITSSLQLNGAIAYTPTARAAALTSGIPSNSTDQWRRATTQAVLGLGLKPFAPTFGAAPPVVAVAPVPTNPLPASPVPTTTPAPTTPAPTTPVATTPTPETPIATQVLGTQSTAQSLALTGSPAKPLIVLGLLLIALGTFAVAAGRKKTQRASELFSLGILAAGMVTAGLVTAAPAGAAEGACSTANGVTVVIDFQELGGGVSTRCVTGQVANGFEALAAAGLSYQTALRSPGFLCKIAGLPATEQCIQPSPTTAYWSYWLANRGGEWCYSTLGAGNISPLPGTVQGWSFSLNRTDSDAPAPRVSPPAALPGMTASVSVAGGCDSAPSVAAASPSQAGAPNPAPNPAAADPAVPNPAVAGQATPNPSAIPNPSATNPAAPNPSSDPAPVSTVTSQPLSDPRTPDPRTPDPRTPDPRNGATTARQQSAAASLNTNAGSTSGSSPIGVMIAVLLIAGLGAGAILLRKRATRS